MRNVIQEALLATRDIWRTCAMPRSSSSWPKGTVRFTNSSQRPVVTIKIILNVDAPCDVECFWSVRIEICGHEWRFPSVRILSYSDFQSLSSKCSATKLHCEIKCGLKRKFHWVTSPGCASALKASAGSSSLASESISSESSLASTGCGNLVNYNNALKKSYLVHLFRRIFPDALKLNAWAILVLLHEPFDPCRASNLESENQKSHQKSEITSEIINREY